MGSMCTRNKDNIHEPVKANQRRQSDSAIDASKISQDTSFNTTFVVAPKGGNDFKEDDYARLEKRAVDRRPSVEKHDPILMQAYGPQRNTKEPNLDEDEPSPPKIRHSIQTNRIGAAQLSFDGLEAPKEPTTNETVGTEKAPDINALLAEFDDTH